MDLKKTAFVWLFAALATCFAFGQKWETGPFEDALAKAEASGKLLLLDFYQEYG